MERMSRAGRIQQIKARMLVTRKRTGKDKFLAGELSRMVGVKSSTWFKKLLSDMVRECELIAGTSAIDGYAHELTYYSLPTMKQLELSERWVIINGQTVRMQ